jgi:hypothetical protein
MDQDTLQRKLDDTANLVKLLLRERNEAIAQTRTYERGISELGSIVSRGGSKADKMLKGGPDPEASRSLEDLKRLFPLAFTLD